MASRVARRKRLKPPSLRYVSLFIGVCALVAEPCFAAGLSDKSSPKRKLEKLSSDQIGERIVNGTPPPKGRYPYVVSLRDPLSLSHLCGGVLIEANVVLTAAHCLRNVASPVVVIGSTLREYRKDKDAEVRYACKTIRHHQFESVEKGFDIALIVLNKKSTKKPIGSLDVGSNGDRTGTRMTAVGWGRITENGPLATELQQIDALEYLNNKKCGTAFEAAITRTMLCAQGRNIDTCQGGPLIWTRRIAGKEEDVLMGLTSFGSKKCEGRYPGVYARVSEFLKWITDKGDPRLNIVDIGPATECEGVEEEVVEVQQVPTGREITERISQDDIKGASKLIFLATEFGTIGEEQLSSAVDAAAKECDALELSRAFNLAVKDIKERKEKRRVSNMIKPFLEKLADVECDIPVPTAKGVLRKISEEETLEAQEDVIKLLKLGSRGRKVLKEIQKVSTKECKVVAFAAIFANAMDLLGIPEQGWEDVFISLFEAIDECEGPPPEVEEPPQEGTPTPDAQPPRAADLIAMVEDGDIDGALATVVELVENGDDVEAELEGAVSLAMEKNLGRDLGFVLITVAGDHPELEDILNPFLEELLERMSVADLVNELLKGDVEDAAVSVATLSSDNEQFPSVTGRKRVILQATEVALEEARKNPKTVDRKVERISQILLEAANMEEADIDVINPAIDVLLVFVP